MKKLILLHAFNIILSAKISVPAYAQTPRNNQETICRSPNIADGGYAVTFDDLNRRARLEEQTIAGPRLLASLVCEKLNRAPAPDALNNTIVCRVPKSRDGWIVRKYVGGFKGLSFASVRYAKYVNGGIVEQEVAFGLLSCEQRY